MLEEINPNNVTGFLKQYLRHVDDPIIPFGLVDEAFALASVLKDDSPVRASHLHVDLTPKMDDALTVGMLSAFINKLAPMNLRVLERLTRHLHGVSTRSDINMMSANNLAIVFGPTLLRPHPSKETPMSMMVNAEKANAFVGAIVQHYPTLFPQ